MKTTSTTRFQFAATILGALAIAVLAPATAHATDNDPAPDGVQCHYTTSDGDDIPIDEGSDVFADGKIVSCRGGSIVITTAPKTNVGGVQQHRLEPDLAVATATPKTPPLVKRAVPASRVH